MVIGGRCFMAGEVKGLKLEVSGWGIGDMNQELCCFLWGGGQWNLEVEEIEVRRSCLGFYRMTCDALKGFSIRGS